MIGIELQLVEERIHLLTYLLTYLLTHLLTQPAVIGIELVEERKVIHVGIQGIPIPLLVLRTLASWRPHARLTRVPFFLDHVRWLAPAYCLGFVSFVLLTPGSPTLREPAVLDCCSYLVFVRHVLTFFFIAFNREFRPPMDS